jgi:hypothetical protein
MPAMTYEGIDLLGMDAANALAMTGRVRIEYQPGNGTRYDVLITSQPERVGPYSGDYGDDMWIVAVLNFGKVAEMHRDEAPFPVYLAEKLTDNNITDGAALHLLLAAIVGQERVTTLAEAGVR